MGKKLLAKNTVASFVSQIVVLVCGFVLPRIFLQNFGSEVNGLINSITQFLGMISFLELGIGAVVQSSLYEPLANKDIHRISCIMKSARGFFRRLAVMFLVYVAVLAIVYPRFSHQRFGYLYTTSLIVVISISSFAQYYFGAVNSLLLNADQRGYVQYNVQIITLILNTIVCAFIISLGASVQLAKLISSLIYFARPIVLYVYVNKYYEINWKVKYVEEPIKQKWNGVAQHVSAVVLEGTDTIVLTAFSTLSNVSIYSVYYLVVKGVKALLLSMMNGIQALIGDLWARRELKQLNDFFEWVEWVVHTGTTYVFACTAVLIVPFIKVYTFGINDAEYCQPLFALLLTLANAMHCLRLPYNVLVLAAGHYRRTQKNYIIAAVLNIVISVMSVKAFGLIGVAIGTLVAMGYQTIWLAIYNSRNLIFWPLRKIVKQFMVDAISFALIVLIGNQNVLINVSYVSWIVLCIKTALEAVIIIVGINFLFYKSMMHKLYKKCGRNDECG